MENIPNPQSLVVGNIYTREDLKYLFTLADARIKTGVFRPRENQSMWLFVTEDKTNGRRHYKNTLGDTPITLILSTILPPPENRDSLIPTNAEIQSYSANDEECLEDDPLQSVENGDAQDEFSAQHVEDERKKVLRSIIRRQGQSRFRKALLGAYQGRCAVTGCKVTELLEAAHIHPYRGEHTNKVNNGLLLRADIHTLFDLGLIGITPDTLRVVVSEKLRGTEYETLHNRPLNRPENQEDIPSLEALQWHNENSYPYG
jgi:putative restriction endonuclease